MTEDHGKLRISNADRDEAIAQLRAALDEGRIDLGEFDERSLAAYSAKTNAELDLIFEDLPGGRPKVGEVVPAAEAPAAAPAARPERREHWIRRVPALRGLVTVGAICTAVWAATWIGSGEPGYFWPIWPILGLGIATVVQVVNLGFGDDDEDGDDGEDRRDRGHRHGHHGGHHGRTSH
ncbi:DUF1707 SHOCT-like domain-containing protein [Glycomyces artemisiae]|uniref:Uncharacterized protein DUF1707 n=1 Tax=Glycomyces artemisiae TaxID=1076443 RepID=A0A2T0UV80_9ACTN|nr:DUF1707 domain-containing protein [Glycomyces artemisiae]PRY61823.1 uncharacterized protein DUF1707 [Glycomyces artemisiae]